MQIAVVKENKQGEKRVAITPQVVKQLIGKGFNVVVESGAGLSSAFEDSAYTAAGATIQADKAQLISNAQILAKVNAPNDDEIQMLKSGQVVISLLFHLFNQETIQKLAAKGVSVFSMDAIPRISRAQSMDVLSSQSNLAGYKAVLLGANQLTRIFPLLMTAAGTVTPSRVLIFGVGVAGLQAIATAKRLGAIVEATDVRPETKEEAESLGAKFIQVEGAGIKTEGGYAKEVSAEYLEKQKEAINNSLRQADLVITTALVMGKKAPVLISEDQVKQMKYGSVIVDMAVEQGGNCACSELDSITKKHGVTIVGLSNIPSMLATNASELYAKNIYNFLTHLADGKGFKWEMEEEITKGTLIIKEGTILK